MIMTDLIISTYVELYHFGFLSHNYVFKIMILSVIIWDNFLKYWTYGK